MRPCENANELARILGIGYGPDGFFLPREWFRHPHDATRDGVFLAGCATGMKPIRNCMIDGSAVAARVIAFLREAAERGMDSSLTTARASAAIFPSRVL
jgi:heterodisulfide reductase subunit A